MEERSTEPRKEQQGQDQHAAFCSPTLQLSKRHFLRSELQAPLRTSERRSNLGLVESECEVIRTENWQCSGHYRTSGTLIKYTLNQRH